MEGTMMLSSRSRPTLVFPVEDLRVDLFMEKSSFPPLGGPKFSKGAATRRVALRAALRARKMLGWSTKMGSNPKKGGIFAYFAL